MTSRIVGFVIIVVVLAGIWFAFIRTTKASVSQTVGNAVGYNVSCSEVGVMAVAGGRSKVYLCQDGALYNGCWADVGGGVSDVTKQARAIKKYGGSDLGC